MLFRKDKEHEKKDAAAPRKVEDMLEEPKAAPVEAEPAPFDELIFPEPKHIPEQQVFPLVREVKIEQSAPLFVKVDKYRDLISGLQEMKLFVSSVKDIFGLMQEIENIRSDALNIMKVTVQRLEKSVIEMDSELLRPKGMTSSPFPQGETEIKHIESSLSELQQQLLALRKELQGIH
jgi:hypothetical protein